MKDSQQQAANIQRDPVRGGRLDPMAFVVALLLAVPIAAVIWFELVYLWFGWSGQDPKGLVNMLSFLAAFALAFGWPLIGAQGPAEVARRSCRLGLLVSLLLVPVTIVVLMLWQNAADRPDLGMGGLILVNLPIVALVLTFVLGAVFSLCGNWAARRMAE